MGTTRPATAADPTAELLAAMAEFDLDPGRIVWDGKLRRFPGPGKKKSNDDGWLVAFPDRFGAFFGDHSRGIHEHWRLNNGQRPDDLDPAEWKRMKAEAAEAQAAREGEREAEQAEVAKECQRRWKAASPPDPEHEYLKAKGITNPEGLRQEGELLLVPAKRLEDDAISSLQEIAPDGTKKFVKGGRAGGTRTTIGAPAFKEDNTLYIAEGWATGWAIHEVTGSAVVVAFSDHNLEPVAVYHREKYPDAKILIAADNDRWTSTYRKGERVPNPGVTCATEAAEAAQAEVVVPNFRPGSNVCLDPECPRECGSGHPTDFHDLWQREGEEAVLKWLDPQMASKAVTEWDPEADEEEEEEAADEEARHASPGDPAEDQEEDGGTWLESAPFGILGYDRSKYFYLPRESGQIHVLSAAGHDRKTLLPLAPLAWWELHFPANNGVRWTMAADALMRASHRAGVFRPENLRGRGCWPDEAGIILHLGDRLLAPDAKSYVDPEGYRCSSNLIYERLPRLAGPSPNRVLELGEARQLLDLCRSPLWRDEASGSLLAGWVALAPLCGALEWRPHVQLVGESGSGKTTVLKELVRPLLGGMLCHVEGGTTEAGIRQRLRADALPVVYDEAEKTDARSDHLIQRVIGLARSASSTGSEVLKGTTHGSALSFQIRSMFCLASIGGAPRQEADKSRISLLVLRGRSQISSEERREHWEGFGPRLKAVDEKTGRQLIARTLRWLRDGRLDETLKVMRGAASAVLGDARAGDQYGTLYAGAWTMMADESPDRLEARELMEGDNLGAYQASATPEGMKCLGVILQQRERVETSNGPRTLSIGQLVDACCGRVSPVTAEEASAHLKPLGLRFEVKDGGYELLVANNSEWISRALRDTPYLGGHPDILRQLDGVKPGGQVRFGPAMRECTTVVPIAVLESENG